MKASPGKDRDYFVFGRQRLREIILHEAFALLQGDMQTKQVENTSVTCAGTQRRGRFWGRMILGLAVVCLGPLVALGGEVAVSSSKLDLRDPNPPVVYDVDGDGCYEILVSGMEGEVALYRSQKVEKLWQKRLGNKALTSPVVGDFRGDGIPVMAVGAMDGTVYFVEAASGELIASHHLSASVAVAPSVAPMDGHDGLVVCDDSGSVRLLTLSGAKVTQEFEVSNTDEQTGSDGNSRRVAIGRIAFPATVGDITGDDVPEIIVGTASGTVQAVPMNKPSERYLWHAAQGTAIGTGIIVGYFEKSGKPRLALATDKGEVIMLAYEQKDGSDTRLVQVQQQRLLAIPAGHMMAADFDDDGYLDFGGASRTAVVTFDGAAQYAYFGTQPYATLTPPLSPVSAVRLEDNQVRLLFGDAQPYLYVLDPLLKSEPRKIAMPEPVSGLCPAGDLSGSGKVEVAYLTKNNRLAVARTDIAANRHWMPTLGYGVDFRRDGQWTTSTVVQLSEARERLDKSVEAVLGQAREALAKKDYPKASQLASRAAAISANRSDARALLGQVNRRLHWFRNLLGWLGGLAVVGFGGYMAFGFLCHSSRLRRANRYMQQGDYERAISEYQLIREKDPANRNCTLALAKAYMESGVTGCEAVGVLEAARQALPDNVEYTLALAKAYSDAGVETDAALDCYLIALATLEEGRGLIAYRVANILFQRKDLEHAQRYYKLALKEGYQDFQVYESLAEIFVETGQYSEKTLGVLEAVHNQHPQDMRLLEGVVRAYAAARRVDEKAREVYEKLLAYDTESAVALRQLAKCELKGGEVAKAAEYAERAAAVSSESAETMALLSHCYVALQRKDEKAVAVYRRALENSPEQADLLRCLALALLERSEPLGEADVQLLKRASTANAKDEELLLGVADSALKRNEIHAAIEALERLVACGSQLAGVYVKLAGAYAAEKRFNPDSERIYREALKSDPENLDLLRSLSQVLVGQQRTDADSMLVLEKCFQRDTSSCEVGEQLARTYLKNERYDDAIKLARYLMQHNKENEELLKIFAQASLSINRLDEAIRQYEHLARLHPEDKEAKLNLAVAYAQKQRLDDDAATRYESALEVDPANSTVRVMLARYHAGAGRIARAVEEFRRVISADPKADKRICDEVRAMIAAFPERTDLRWFLTNTLIDRGSMSEPMEQLQAIFEIDPSQIKLVLQGYDRVLAKDPSNLNANLHKGVLLKAQGRFEEARAFLERAHKMNTANLDAMNELEDLYEHLLTEEDDVETRFGLGKLYYAQNDYDRAIGHFQRTAQDFRYENESIKMLGLCFVGKGMLEFALQEFRKLVIDEEMKEILYDLAQRYEAKNDIVGAKQVYRLLFAADINYRNVKTKFEMLAGSTSDPIILDRTSVITQLSERARRRYELLEELGRGAMGIVYKAKDNELDEIVALKILPDNMSQSPEAIQRFRAEARSARRLAHPNIVRIHDIGEELGRKYISMEFISGSDLKKHLRSRGVMEVGELAAVLVQICSALDYAHSMGIVHRDIKPANIMLTENLVVKVSDFGIAKILESTSETIAGSVIGTPLYMSPEQIQGYPVDNRADIYSLGIMSYELISGRPPFTEGDLAYQHMRVAPKSLEGVPQAFEEIIMRCLAKDRDQRWATAGEMLRALEKSGLAGKGQ